MLEDVGERVICVIPKTGRARKSGRKLRMIVPPSFLKAVAHPYTQTRTLKQISTPPEPDHSSRWSSTVTASHALEAILA
jgi:hypothetical protein